jgi:hypothetical protein
MGLGEERLCWCTETLFGPDFLLSLLGTHLTLSAISLTSFLEPECPLPIGNRNPAEGSGRRPPSKCGDSHARVESFGAFASHGAVVGEARPTVRQGQPPGPRPTLGQLQRSHRWTWVYCEKCLHHAPMALVPLIIRWGADTSSDRLRRCARCTKCGYKGATLQHPGWAGTHIGFQPFPAPVESSSQS